MTHARSYPQVKIRVPPELKAAIEGLAKQNLRSLNNEIVKRLMASLEVPDARH